MTRKAYKDPQAQIEANKRYLDKNPEARAKRKIITTRSHAKRYIREYLTLEEVEEFRELIFERVKQLKGV